MIYRIFPVKDTVITNDQRSYSRMTASNVGLAEALEVFKKSGISGAIGTLGSSSLARTLMQFNLQEVWNLTASANAPTTGITYQLKVNHKTAAKELPYSFNIDIMPLSTSWDEGRGVDDEDLSDEGFANWEQPTSTTYWTTAGGDFLTSPTQSVHFDTGYEDIDCDVTNIFGPWVTGTLQNNGLLLKLSGNLESNSLYSDYYTKKFYSRTSNFQDRRPYVELRWNDFIADDRINMRWDRTGSLVLYNVVKGQFQNITGTPIITRITDMSGNVLLTLTASYSGFTGIYSATFALPSGTTYTGSIFYDKWNRGSFALMTSSFSFKLDGGSSDGDPPQLLAKVKNLKNEYRSDEVVKFQVAFKKKGILPVARTTASFSSEPYISEKAYYAIENESTSEQIIPFMTGTGEYTKLSYDSNGNYFKLYMRNLHSGNVYKIVLLVDELGYKQVIDSGFKFKVV